MPYKTGDSASAQSDAPMSPQAHLFLHRDRNRGHDRKLGPAAAKTAPGSLHGVVLGRGWKENR